jgi:3-phenylpropionate/cinnamic acid dioxygenase small subunit
MTDARGAIENLMHRYAELMDAGDASGLAAFFGDAEIVVEPGENVRPERVGSYRGRDQIYAFYGGDAAPARAGAFMHMTTNSIVEVDEGAGTATARSYYAVLSRVAAGQIGVVVAGRYRDRFELVGSEWRFASRAYLTSLAGSALNALTGGDA